MATVTAVHEEMHKRAGENEQPREVWNEVGAVLSNEVEPGDGQESDQYNIRRQGEET